MSTIRQSDTTFDDVDHDELLTDQAEHYVTQYLMQSDLDALSHNCASHTSVGHKCYLEALAV